MKEQLWQGIIRGTPHQVLAEQRATHISISIEPVNEGFLTDLLKDTSSFAKKHPFLTGMAAYYAYDSVRNYLKAKSSAVRLRAKDHKEFANYKSMIKAMEQNGWKVVKSGYVAGTTQYEWELHNK